MTGDVAGDPGAGDDADADRDLAGDQDPGGDDERHWWQRRRVRLVAVVLGILVGFVLAAELVWLVQAPDARPEARRAVLAFTWQPPA